MNNIDLFRMSIGNLWRRKLRTSLTVLGVIIGTSSIVLMISLGLAMSANFQTQVEQWGSLTVVEVHSGGGGMMSMDGGMSGYQEGQIDDAVIESFRKIPNVDLVIPTIDVNANLIMGKYVTPWGVNIVGMDPEMMAALDYNVAEGRAMLENEENVIVMGSEIPYELTKKGKLPNWENREKAPVNYFEERVQVTFEDLDPHSGQGGGFGEEAPKAKPPKPLNAKVVGILPEGNWETAYNIYMPMKNVLNLIEEKEIYEAKLRGDKVSKKKKPRIYNNVKVKVNDMKNVTQVQEAIESLGYNAYSNMDSLNQMNEMAAGIQLILGGIGAISLLVAAIGITNTMIMAIYERTREIGIMKVIGAVISDIRKMFLIESAFIGFLGGLVGILFCYLASWGLNTFGAGLAEGLMGMGGGYGDTKTYVSIIPLWLSLFALGFSTLIGLVAGYFPAKRAMKLSALSAIRTQ